jgi:hypothetical protein
MAKDIAEETLKVGNALTSVRIDQMILNLAKGIAWGQYELDKVGVEITKMMGAPGTVSIGGEQLSMLEAGFVPSFYHFVDTILELKMEIKVREESNSSTSFSTSQSGSTSTEVYAEASGKAKGSIGFASVEAGFKAGFNQKSTAAYSTALDSKHSQTFSQDLSASSLMRTKLVPVPPPELLVERIKILLEKLRKEAETDEKKSESKALESLGQQLFGIATAGLTGFSATTLDNPGDEVKDKILEAFKGQTDHLLLKKFTLSPVAPKGTVVGEGSAAQKVDKWIIKDRADNKYILVCRYSDQAPAPAMIEVYSGGQTQKTLFGFDELLDIPTP